MKLHSFITLKKTLDLWSNRPFAQARHILVPLGVSVFVFFFLWILEPCRIDQIEHGKAAFITGYALIAFFCLLFTTVFIPRMFKKVFDRNSWTVGKYFLNALAEYFLISFCSWVYTNTLGEQFIGHFDILPFFLISFCVSIFPSTALILAYDRINYHRRKSVSSELNKMIGLQTARSSNSQTDDFINALDPSLPDVKGHDFICAISNGNYITIYFRNNEKTDRKVIRYRLSSFEVLLSNRFPDILRCHRTAIINLHHVENLSTNNRMYTLQLASLDFQVNISKSHSKEVLARMKERLGHERLS